MHLVQKPLLNGYIIVVLQGEKWSATKWIHVEAFGRGAEWQTNKWKGCVDANENCDYWARTGECDKNKAYMHVYCKLSCNLCEKTNTTGEAAAAA